MRLLPFTLLFGAATLATAVASTLSDPEEDDYTSFNGKTVPPLQELTPDNFDEEIKASKWLFVKHYR